MDARLLPLLLLIACEPAEPETFSYDDPDDSASPGDDTDDTDTPVDPGPIPGLGVRIHEEIGSLVYAQWTQEEAGSARVEYSFDEGIWLTSPTTERGEGEQEQLLLGIPFGTAFTWRVVLKVGDETLASADQAAETDPLDPDFPLPELHVADEALYEPSGNYLLTSINEASGGWRGGNYWKFILDRQGRVVWAMLTPLEHWSIFLRQARNGRDILWDEATYWSDFDGGDGSRVHRMKIDGTIVETYDTPGLHHAFVELADERLVWGAVDGQNEQLVEQDGGGQVRTIWDCAQFHGSIGQPQSCQSNSLYWHEPTDTFLYSFYTTSTIVEIDHETGDTLWFASEELTGGLDVDPPKSQFSWQHGVYYTDEGTLLLSSKYNNPGSGNETVAREYVVDVEGETMSEVWSFGEDEGVYASTAGEAHRLPNGNTLHNYGSDGRVREVTPDGDVVWDVEWEGDRLLGRSTFIEDLYDFAP